MAKQLIKNGALVSDEWTLVEDDEPLTEAPSIVSVNRLLHDDALAERNAPLAVILRAGTKTGEDVYALAPYLDRLTMIAIEFPVFRNGRGYSSARILREELGYQGELRAEGEVLYDQLLFLSRCGFDSYHIDDTIDPAQFAKALNTLPDAYQPSDTHNAGILWRRHLSS